MLNMNDLGCLNYLEEEEQKKKKIENIVASSLKFEKELLRGEVDMVITDVTDKDIKEINDRLQAAGSPLRIRSDYPMGY